jgi:hypothetical protein
MSFILNHKYMTRETLKRGFYRALLAFIAGSAGAFAVIPVNLEDPKRYLTVLFVGMVAGGLMGLQKLISGYLKYDRK